MDIFEERIDDLLQEDSRYPREAYHFVRDALTVAQRMLGRKEEGDESHLTGQELCEAIRIHALHQFGYLALTVLHAWGVRETDDFGEIVYNLIDVQLMNKSETDRREDFHAVYDFEQAFRKEFRITAGE